MSAMLIGAGLGSIVMMRTRATPRMALLRRVPLMPGAREKVMRKDQSGSYPEPALVPQGEKPQVCG